MPPETATPDPVGSTFLRYSLFAQWAVVLYYLGYEVLVIYVHAQNGATYSRGCDPATLEESVFSLLPLLYGFSVTFLFRHYPRLWPLYSLWVLFIILVSLVAGHPLFLLFAAICAFSLVLFLNDRFRPRKLTSGPRENAPEEY